MKHSVAWSREAGFTLVEALLATGLMFVIVGALATLTGLWLPNWDRVFVRTQRMELLAAGLDRLIADLAAAEFVSPVGSTPAFEGDPLSVTFIRTTIGPNASTGLEFVRIGETFDDRGAALVRSTAPFKPMSGNSGDTKAIERLIFSQQVVVLRAPYRVAFSYAGSDRVWRDTWRGIGQLPRAIRVLVRDAATSKKLAVSTSTLIGSEVPAKCVLAKTAAECPILRVKPK